MTRMIWSTQSDVEIGRQRMHVVAKRLREESLTPNERTRLNAHWRYLRSRLHSLSKALSA